MFPSIPAEFVASAALLWLTVGTVYGKWKARVTEVMAAYGPVALLTHYSAGLLFFLGFAGAWHFGFGERLVQLFGGGEAFKDLGKWAFAYAVYKATMLPRMMVTAVLTPLIARLAGKAPKGPPPDVPPQP